MGDCKAIAVQAPDSQSVSVVVPVDRPVAVLIPAQPGPQGRPGVGAGGVSFIQDSPPSGAQEGQTWWNPLTLQLKVYHEDQFEPVSPDGGYF